MYQAQAPDGSVCVQVQRDAPVPSKVYYQHPVGSTIMIWYLAGNPSIAYAEGSEWIVWSEASMPLVVGVVAGLAAYLKRYKWV